MRVEVLRKIEVLPQPNRQLTARAKRAAEQRAAQAAEEAGMKAGHPLRTPRGVFLPSICAIARWLPSRFCSGWRLRSRAVAGTKSAWRAPVKDGRCGGSSSAFKVL